MSNENIQPKESYTFKYSQVDIKEMYKFTVGRTFNRFIISLVLLIFVILVVLFLNSNSYGNYAFLGMVLILTILHCKAYHASKKAWTKSESRIETSEYYYGVYEGYFLLTILRNGEKIRESKLSYAEIDKVHNYHGYVLLQVNNELITLRESEIKSDSLLYTKIKSNKNFSKMKTPIKATGVWNVISWVLFIASIFSIFMAILQQHPM